jgi:hypothetical protein
MSGRQAAVDEGMGEVGTGRDEDGHSAGITEHLRAVHERCRKRRRIGVSLPSAAGPRQVPTGGSFGFCGRAIHPCDDINATRRDGTACDAMRWHGMQWDAMGLDGMGCGAARRGAMRCDAHCCSSADESRL